jgi:hypothetical protein
MSVNSIFINYSFIEILVRWQQACSFWFIPEQIEYEATSNNREVSTPDDSINIQSSNQLHHQYSVVKLSPFQSQLSPPACRSVSIDKQIYYQKANSIILQQLILSTHTTHLAKDGGRLPYTLFVFISYGRFWGSCCCLRIDNEVQAVDISGRFKGGGSRSFRIVCNNQPIHCHIAEQGFQ